MSDVVLSIENLKKTYKKQVVLSGINMQFEEGRIYGLIGPNGVGKTTLIRIIAGLSKADSGTIQFYQNRNSVRIEEMQKEIGCIIERPYLDESMTAIENMRLVGFLKGVEDRDILVNCLKTVGLTDDNKKVKNYSLGMKQRLGIAELLINNPKIMFLDEPMNGLDPQGVIQLRGLLLDMAQNKKITIVVTSHILSEMSKLCDAFYFVKNGNIVKYIDILKENVQIDLEEVYLKYIAD